MLCAHVRSLLRARLLYPRFSIMSITWKNTLRETKAPILWDATLPVWEILSDGGCSSLLGILVQPTSMTGQGTFLRSSLIRLSNGSIHPGVTSQWESRKVRTFPRAIWAPFSLDLTIPLRLLLYSKVIFWVLGRSAFSFSMYVCNFFLGSPVKIRSKVCLAKLDIKVLGFLMLKMIPSLGFVWSYIHQQAPQTWNKVFPKI